MSELKATPGPWLWHDEKLHGFFGGVYFDPQDEQKPCTDICAIVDGEQSLANMLLISAVTDLLAAALGMLNPTGHTDACTEHRAFGETQCSKKCAALRAAVAKARGEQ